MGSTLEVDIRAYYILIVVAIIVYTALVECLVFNDTTKLLEKRK